LVMYPWLFPSRVRLRSHEYSILISLMSASVKLASFR
jgi:hypothetical protein